MSTEREMLEWAAKAGGIEASWLCADEEYADCLAQTEGMWLNGSRGPDNSAYWNPRRNDGDNRRLQIDCGLTLARFPDAMVAMHSPSGRSWAERHDDHDGDSYAAARLAVLRAAAALGRDMP